ncbi:Galactose mutarotase [Alteracholeplasma palmae J233]|uniref:Aldose 1-epimerase n=1 Tax=Alteracholeplasma palmae (strain ATCC 49389 / J233) TaxID=1318466 RepID=U4KL16_ALTPJ|nr:aldose epimerase family protein [Alteracholeplasma palmae]CCV64554.1 Galactose mutarotase [Alteracholeplasma palmae J233]
MKIYEIKNEYQTLKVLDQGATMYQWLAYEDKKNIILTNKDLKVYDGPRTGFYGNTIGRVANRIKDGKFEIDGKVYQLNRNFAGNHGGHGGPTGFYMRTFDVIKKTDEEIVLRYLSKDGEEGYPGNLTLDVSYKLDKNQLLVTYTATTDKKTPINITNHVHFNLSEENTILNHKLKVSANKFLDTDEFSIPSGQLIDVTNTPLDFRKEVRIGDIIEDPFLQNSSKKGIDHNLVFEKNNHTVLLTYKNKSLKMETSYPSLQIYSMNFPSGQMLTRDVIVNKYHGIAFESQYEIDAVNHPEFSNIILKPGETFKQTVTYTLEEK